MSEEWNYEELLQEFDEYVQEYIHNNGYNSTHAKIAARDDFEYEMRDSDLVRAVIIMRFGELLLEEPYLLQIAPNDIHKQFNRVNAEILKSHLSPEQYRELMHRMQSVSKRIQNHPVTPNNTARWFYYQLIEQVHQYHNSLSKNEMNANEIAKEMIYKFRMALSSSGEKVNLYTTIVECFLNNYLMDNNIFNKAKKILEEFDPQSLGNSFTEEEKQHLLKRIQNVLQKLDELNI